MRSILTWALCVLLLVVTIPASVVAQSLPGLSASSTETAPETNDLADAIRAAADRGVSVVVVDANGNLVGTSAPPVDDATAPKDDSMEGASSLMKAQTEVQAFRATLRERLDALPNSLNEVAYILRATSPDGTIMAYVKVVLYSALLFVFSYFVMIEIYGKRIARNFVVSRVMEDPQGYREKMPFLVFRFFMGIGGTVFSMVVAYVTGALIFGSVDDLSIQLTITAVYAVYFLSRTLSDVWRMLLSPFLSQYRIPVFSDRDAKRAYYWISVIASYSIASQVFATWIADFGLNYNVYAILSSGLSLIGAIGLILMVLFNRCAVSNAILGGKPAETTTLVPRLLSVFWAPLLILYFIFGWFELTFDLVLEQPTGVPLISAAFGVFLSVMVVYGLINYVIDRFFDRRLTVERLNQEMAEADAAEDQAEVKQAEEALSPYRPAIATFEQLARRVAGILAFVAGAYAILQIWDPEGLVLQESLLGRMLDVIVILFIGYILYHFFRIWIDSKIAEEAPDAEEGELGDEGGGASASRLATLLPLFRGAILAVVIVAISLIALMEIGINVSPLFAGAGVVGLAVGFGAQTLVRDVFSGAFFLVDDAFRKGEYIDIGGVKGTVEKISVRSFQLRHHLGALHTIPFGEIQVLTNYSRDWVIMKLPLRVTYDTDVEYVRKIIKKLGQSLLDDPVIGDNFIQPLKSQGVIEMQDSAMIIRVKFMTKPGDQWLVRKKVYEEIRDLFAREGIKFAHREVTVRLADGKVEDLSEEQREAIAGSVQGVIEEEFLDDQSASVDDR